ncbi:MAG: hypothetical protein WDZ30_10770 [Cellvibrionaceae bacterium]
MFTCQYKLDKKSYNGVLNAYQAIYAHKAANPLLVSFYHLTIWMMIAALIFVAAQVRDYALGSAWMFWAFVFVAACAPANWYINRRFLTRYNQALVDDIGKGLHETTMTLDEEGLEVRAGAAHYKVGWQGVHTAYRTRDFLVLLCDMDLFAVPLEWEEQEQKEHSAALLDAFEQYSGKRMEVVGEVRE